MHNPNLPDRQKLIMNEIGQNCKKIITQIRQIDNPNTPFICLNNTLNTTKIWPPQNLYKKHSIETHGRIWTINKYTRDRNWTVITPYKDEVGQTNTRGDINVEICQKFPIQNVFPWKQKKDEGTWPISAI